MTTQIATLVLATGIDDPQQTGEGLNLWVLLGSVALFLAIVVAITLLRRWR
jgi:hypothetical protein